MMSNRLQIISGGKKAEYDSFFSFLYLFFYIFLVLPFFQGFIMDYGLTEARLEYWFYKNLIFRAQRRWALVYHGLLCDVVVGVCRLAIPMSRRVWRLHGHAEPEGGHGVAYRTGAAAPGESIFLLYAARRYRDPGPWQHPDLQHA